MAKSGVNVEVKFNEGLVNTIITSTKKGIKQGNLYYKKKVEQELKSAPWGSVRVGKGTYVSKKRSSTGETPYRQTGNLSRSLKAEFNDKIGEFEAKTYSEAPYALELELGGQQNSYPDKPYAQRTLSNGLHSLKLFTGARPTFKKVWETHEKNIFNIIKSRVPFVTRFITIFKF